MAHIDPEETRHDREKAGKATNEYSGHSIEGDTPPAEGLGVGPTNKENDVDRPGEGAKGKIALVLILVLVVVFLALVVVGRIVGMF